MSATYVTAPDYELFRMARALSIPNAVFIPIIRKYKTWQSSMGAEVTIDRLKAMKVALLTGELPPTQTWIGSRDGIPKGVFRPLFSRWISRESALHFLNVVISSTTSKSLTSRQWTKFIQSAERQPVYDDMVSSLPELVKPLAAGIASFAGVIKHHAGSAQYDNPYRWTGTSDETKADLVLWDGSINREPEREAINPECHWDTIPDVIPFPKWKGGYYLDVTQCYAFGTGLGMGPVLSCEKLSQYETTPDVLSGRISIIQERGMKARVVANPLRVHQMALSRLSNFLFGVLRELPWDFTYAQGDAVLAVKTALTAGKTVYCFDISDASNNIPLDLQKEVFSEMLKVAPPCERE